MDQHGRALAFIVVASLMLVVTHIGFLGNALGFSFFLFSFFLRVLSKKSLKQKESYHPHTNQPTNQPNNQPTNQINIYAKTGYWLIDPIPLLVWMGIAYSLGAASMWPIVSVAVPPKLVGTAYGAMCSIQVSFFVSLFPFSCSIMIPPPHILFLFLPFKTEFRFGHFPSNCGSYR